MNSPNLSTCDAIIFDLDGTLWNACEPCALAWNKSLEQFGIDHRAVDVAMVASFSGLKIDHILNRFFPFIPAAEHVHFLEIYHQHEKEQMRKNGGLLYPKIKEVLETLATRFPLFIVSNCMSGYVENFMRFHGFDKVFRDFECSGNTGLSKAENIELVISRNHLQRPAYVGDTVWDQEAAMANNLPFVFAAYGFGKATTPVYQVESPVGLLEVFL